MFLNGRIYKMYVVVLVLFGFLSSVTLQNDFPIDEHLDLSTEDVGNGIEQVCKGQNSLHCCFCDEQCFRNRNCCIDKLWNTSHPIPLEEYYEKMINESEKYVDTTTCEPVFPLAYKYNHESHARRMVSKCQQGSTTEEVSACKNVNDIESYEYNIPVFGNDNQLYKNSQCARCNSVEQFRIINLRADCVGIVNPYIPPIPGQPTTTQSPVITNRFNNCTFTIASNEISGLKPPNTQTCRIGLYRSRDNCKQTSKYYKLCHSYYGIMDTYANYHCYLCENENKSNSSAPSPFMCPYKKPFEPWMKWSFTLSFSKQTKIEIVGDGVNILETVCSKDKLYNPFTGECDVFKCSFGYKVNGSKCIKLPPEKNTQTPVVINPSYDKCLVQNNNVVVATLLGSNVFKIQEALKAIHNSTKQIELKEIYQKENLTYYQTNIKISSFNIFNIKTSNASTDIWQYVENIYILEYSVSITELHGLDFSRMFPGKICAYAKTYENDMFNLTTSCTLTISNSSLTRQNYSQWIVYNKTSIQRKLSTCNEYYLQSSCKLTAINSNYSISAENQTLTVSDKTFEVSEYTPLKEGVGVCNTVNLAPTPVRYSWMVTKDVWEEYISIIGTSLSIICYIIIITTYLYFKELRTIPGLTIVGLCGTLLFTDILFLVATQVTEYILTCKIIAMLLHWGLLTIQAWILVISFDLLSNFGSVGLAAAKDSQNRFTQYCLFALLLPSLLVGITIIIHEYNIYDIGYGEQGICFIYYLYPRVYFYIIPVATSLLLTIISFTRSITVITIKERSMRNELNSSGRQKNTLIFIAFKMILMLGLIEIIGFVQIRRENLTEKEEIFNSVFAILYSLCRSLRGVILVVIYIFKKQKWVLYKSVFGCNNKEFRSRAKTLEEDISTSRT